MPGRIQVLLGTCLLALGAASGGALSLHITEAVPGTLHPAQTASPRAVHGDSNTQATGRYCRPLLKSESKQVDAGERGSTPPVNCQEDSRLRRSLVST
jgi:hypothetical protein